MTDHVQTAGWITLWPLPFVLVALVCAVIGWPREDSGIWVLAAVLNFGLLYAVIMVIARLVQHGFTTRAVAIATVICVIYHVIAVAIPRPESGWIRISLGDVMIGGGALVFAAIDEIMTPLRDGVFENPARLERALTTDDTARFHVSHTSSDADGWVLFGRLHDQHGAGAYHIARIREPFSIESTVFDTAHVSNHMVLDKGTLRTLGFDSMVTATPGQEPQVTTLPPETRALLDSAGERVITYDHGSWLVLFATGDSGGVGRIAPDGKLEEHVALSLTNAYPKSVVRVGSVTYALTDHFNPEHWVVHVIENGARDDARSEVLTAAVEARGLGTPLELVASKSQLWLFGYDTTSDSRVAIALPDGEPVLVGPGSVTGVISDGDDLIVGTLKAVVRVRSDGAQVLGEGWIPEGMLSVRGHKPSVAVKERRSQKITLTTFENGNAVPFLPDLRLEAQR